MASSVDSSGDCVDCGCRLLILGAPPALRPHSYPNLHLLCIFASSYTTLPSIISWTLVDLTHYFRHDKALPRAFHSFTLQLAIDPRCVNLNHDPTNSDDVPFDLL
jgi:hypothetical protein